VAHFSILLKLKNSEFLILTFSILKLIPPKDSLSWAPPQCGPSKYHALRWWWCFRCFALPSGISHRQWGDCLLSTFRRYGVGVGLHDFICWRVLLSGTRAISRCDFNGNCVFVTILWVFVCNAYVGYRRRIFLKIKKGRKAFWRKNNAPGIKCPYTPSTPLQNSCPLAWGRSSPIESRQTMVWGARPHGGCGWWRDHKWKSHVGHWGDISASVGIGQTWSLLTIWGWWHQIL
jgi:hypothetical protein